jgi:hypothetical protein
MSAPSRQKLLQILKQPQLRRRMSTNVLLRVQQRMPLMR